VCYSHPNNRIWEGLSSNVGKLTKYVLEERYGIFADGKEGLFYTSINGWFGREKKDSSCCYLVLGDLFLRLRKNFRNIFVYPLSISYFCDIKRNVKPNK
ncbi:hypothetical protein, partial [Tannerella forsythia]|uniref:hypothetical protein n=1 Tax=Tannerella forsythia TaxID=28112 RepID=UPI0028E882CE